MTRFSTVAGVVAAVMVWLVSSNGCIAALVQARSDATAAMAEERRSLYVALDSLPAADEAGRTNLRRAAALLYPGKTDLDGMEGRDTNETENHVQGQRKRAQQSKKALQTPASSLSSAQSFLMDAMLHKSSPVSFSSHSASSTISNMSPSHQRDLRRKMNESEINDSCSDSNPTLVASGAMVTGSLKGAQSSIAESCTWSDAGKIGLWCKYTVFVVSLLCRHFKPRVTRFKRHMR
jgi:hypothetical protein